MNRRAAATLFLATWVLLPDARSAPIGTQGTVGCRDNPRKVERLQITEPGVYENYLVDSNWAGGNRVKITADNVILRNCEIRNATGNGVGVFGRNVVIENCKIHHLLAGDFKNQDDAHGITGSWGDLTIRNCDISCISGDCIQFDPNRKSTGSLVIENCNLWTGPLPADAAGFKKGERPGENALDTKTPAGEEPSKVVIRNCLFYGWNQPAQIDNVAALNLKENIHVRIGNSLFRDNEIAFRLRGPTGRGGAEVSIQSCAIFDTVTGVRMENHLRNLKIERLGFGTGVTRKYHRAGKDPFPGYENIGEFEAADFDSLLKNGIE